MTYEDPWATSAPEPEQPAPPATTTVVNNSSRPVAEGEGKIVTTLKGGRDFDAPWVVIHAASVAESDALLDSAFKDYLEKVQKVASVFAGAAPASLSSSGGQQASRPAQRPAPAGAQEPPSWAPPKPEPDYVYRTGVGKNDGKVWHAWYPPDRSDTRPKKYFYPPR
ncbi:hypothetical protein [Mycolicibacterium houstonense]|uniref:hypothetical protein n=1 Tax=Mycolicibacterium houstonense TaxID=146021 RepID=UPI00082A6A3A|nr:hypothetical protein [Mycolicibacterium houstonense]